MVTIVRKPLPFAKNLSKYKTYNVKMFNKGDIMEYTYSNAERAQILVQALPYIKKHSGKIVVIKYGGNAMINETLKQQVMEDIVLLWHVGVKIVLVHGGGPEINDLMKRLGKKAEFVDGLRVTDKETIDIRQSEQHAGEPVADAGRQCPGTIRRGRASDKM